MNTSPHADNFYVAPNGPLADVVRDAEGSALYFHTAAQADAERVARGLTATHHVAEYGRVIA